MFDAELADALKFLARENLPNGIMTVATVSCTELAKCRVKKVLLRGV